MILDIFITLLLVVLNGFFVAAEFAIVKVRSSQVDIKAATGHRVAQTAKHITNHLDAYLSATQLGITLASLGLGWIGEEVVGEMLVNLFSVLNLEISQATIHKIALPTAFTIITVLHIVFGELAPKSIAIRHPEPTTLAIAIPLNIFYTIFKPFIWVLNGLANVILRAIGIPPVQEQDSHTEQEIRLLLEQSREGGTIRQSEHELIENVFRFDERSAKQVMIPRTKIIALDIEAEIDEIFETVLEEGFSRMPVYQNSLDNIIGIVYTKDILKMLKNRSEMTLKTILRKVYFVPESKRLSDLLREFQRQRLHMAVVLDEFGGTSGIVTLEDIIEEIVGDIQDEYDEEMPIYQKVSDNEVILNAHASILDINRHLPSPLPEEEDFDTVAGFINFIFGRIPEPGETKRYGKYEFTILSKHANRLDSIKVKFLTFQEQTAEEET